MRNLLTLLLFIGASVNASASGAPGLPDIQSYGLQCVGQTSTGDKYTVSVSYSMDSAWWSQGDPFVISLGNRSSVTVQVQRGNELIANKSMYMNDLAISVTDDQTVYQFRDLYLDNSSAGTPEKVGKFVTIVRTAERPDSMDFSVLTDSTASFKNAACTEF